MKKVLSILLSICMLVGCFVAMIPSANAAEDVSLPKRGELLYSEDFEDAAYTSLNGADLETALGWQDSTPNVLTDFYITTDTTTAVGAATPTPEDGDHWLRIRPNTTWENTKIFEDERLIGGGYIIEYEQLMVDNTSGDGQGMGFRTTECWQEGYTTWNFNAKERGNYDVHTSVKGTTSTTNSPTEVDEAKESVTYHNYNASSGLFDGNEQVRDKGSIMGQVIRFRIYVDPEMGVSAYKVNPETGELTLAAKSNSTVVSTWGAYSKFIPAGIVIRCLGGPTMLVDDIKIYLADNSDYNIPSIFAYQTTDLTQDTYDIRFLGKIDKVLNANCLGYKVEYRYLDKASDTVYTGTQSVACSYIYSSVSVNEGTETLQFEDFGIVALHIEGVPTTHDITFTITPFAGFWKEIDGQYVYEYGMSTTYTVILPD